MTIAGHWSPNRLDARGQALTLRAHGGFYVGALQKRHGQQTFVDGQAYVEYLVPAPIRQAWPVVMIHGGGSNGLDFLTTPDGREGWAYRFARRGFCVYVLDRTGCGRAARHPVFADDLALPTPLEAVAERFIPAPRSTDVPAHRAHTQWPLTPDGVAKDQFSARLGPSIGSLQDSHTHARRVGPALLADIGPAILLTHSLGALWGWAIADSAPSLVKGIVAVEPYGPPFATHPTGRLQGGITADQLQNLGAWQDLPMAVVTAAASRQAASDAATVAFLAQHGAQVSHLRLGDLGKHGNGHAPMLELNSDEVADALIAWLSTQALAHDEPILQRE